MVLIITNKRDMDDLAKGDTLSPAFAEHLAAERLGGKRRAGWLQSGGCCWRCGLCGPDG